MALRLAQANGVVGLGAADETARVAAAAVGLFGLSGFALTRLGLPGALRRNEALWILPVGAASSAIALTVLGFAAIPFAVSLGVVLAAGAVSSAFAVRRAGLPSLRRAAWPAYLAVLVACVALIPVFRAGFPTVIGNGSDSVLAVGSAKFLQGHYPTSVATDEPIDRMPLVWRSKQAIYYAFGAVASLAGLETFQALPLLAAILLALAAAGFYVLARDVLGGGLLAGCLALLAVGLDQVSLHTTMHPYFNQLWGFVALPWALALSWAVAERPTRAGAGLLALFLLVGAFAYPLALPVALIPLLVLRGRRLARRPRFRWWMVPVGLALVVPLRGVFEKAVTAARVVAPGSSLANWGGDLDGWFALHTFLFTGSTLALVVFTPMLLGGLVLALHSTERRLAAGLAAVVAFGALCAVYFRVRDDGWYFHFKALAFTAPIALTLALVGLASLRDRGRRWRVGVTVALAALVLTGLRGATAEISHTFDQLPRDTLALHEADRDLLPRGTSIRLDVVPDSQLWAGYMLSGHPQSAQRPLLGTNYPHVPIGRKADFILADPALDRPFDAIGPALLRNPKFAIYRMNPDVPGPDRSSRRMIETVTRIR